MNTWPEMLEYCYGHENLFVDEIDRIQTSPEQLRLFPANALQHGGGWLFMAGELGSGDWNLARLIGDAKIAAMQLDLLPQLETHLLVPGEAASLFVGQFKQLGSLVYFSDTCELNIQETLSAAEGKDVCCAKTVATLIDNLKSNGFAVKFKDSTGAFADKQNEDLTIYLLDNGRVQGYIKTIRTTGNCLEVYIEVIPSLRQRGLGRTLLSLAVARAGVLGKSIIYAVDEENTASMATARSAGLQEILRLSRFLKPVLPHKQSF